MTDTIAFFFIENCHFGKFLMINLLNLELSQYYFCPAVTQMLVVLYALLISSFYVCQSLMLFSRLTDCSPE